MTDRSSQTETATDVQITNRHDALANQVEPTQLGTKGKPVDTWLHDWATAKGDGTDLSELVPVTLTPAFESEDTDDSLTGRSRTASRLAPSLTTEGERAFNAQVSTVSHDNPITVILPSKEIQKFENHRDWQVSFQPEDAIRSMFRRNYLPSTIFGEDRNPVYSDIWFDFLSYALPDGEEIEWKGPPSLARNDDLLYVNQLREALGHESQTSTDPSAKTLKSELHSTDRSVLVDYASEYTDISEPRFEQTTTLVEALVDSDLTRAELEADNE